MIIYKILQSLTHDDQMMTYAFEGHNFNIKVYDFITYMCLTKKEVDNTLPRAFLNDICNLFNPIKNNIMKVGKFNIILHNQMKMYSNAKFEFTQISKIQKDVDDAKHIMINNIENVMKRGNQLITLEENAVSIEIEAEKLKIGAEIVKEKVTKWNILRILLSGGCIFIMIIGGLLIWYLTCGGINFQCGRMPINGTK